MENIFDTIIIGLQELLKLIIKVLPTILVALIIGLLTRHTANFLKGFSEKISKKTLKSKSLQLLVIKITNVGTWIVGSLLICVFIFPGLTLGDIVAALGLSSVAIGFAFQDIFKNFLSGVLILIQEPFRINDQIIVDGYEGTVELIDIRTTRIKTYTGEKILVPNSKIFADAVRVRTAYDNRRTDLNVGIDYNTSLPNVKEILQDTIIQVEGVLKYPCPEVDLIAFGDSSIDLIVRYWTTPREPTVRKVQTKAIIAIKQAFDQANINIPYPIRSIHYYNQ
ncbi:MAG: mechanosensitive ion channel family protein [cyanobacterium endosymbiont of Rhopalodia sterrenbergii]